MILLLPYAHERQTVQRLPYVTFTLIALNFVIFLWTNYGTGSDEEYYQKLEEFQQYAYTHHELVIPPEGRKYFESWQLEELDALHEAVNFQDLDPEEIRRDQQHLNGLLSEMKTLKNQNPFDKFGYKPAEPRFVTIITSLFIHEGWMHLLGNMFFLYLAGCSIEDLWGRPLYAGFYILSGIVATLIHALKFPEATEPIIGASGAIAGLMGAFMVRLYNTQISFFYMIWLWVRGTFKAPAYIMLPLWLLQQFFYAMLDDSGNYGVAFWAHIGGFIFGALFAFGMSKLQIEEKYIAPKIEKKVGLVQNPDYLRAMNLSEQGNLPDALILLHRVVRNDPNHLEAYLEMKRISEVNHDAALFNKFSVATIDILLRTKEWDLLLDFYHQFRASPLHTQLPAKSLLALGTFFEETLDFRSAAERYEEVTKHFPDDPLSMKAYSKLARLYFDKINDRQKGIENFWRAYNHPLADAQWRAALQSDIKKYQIPEIATPAVSAAQPAPEVVPALAPVSYSVMEQHPIEGEVPEEKYDDSTQAFPAGLPQEIQPVEPVVPTPPPLPPRDVVRRDSAGMTNLPNAQFDGDPTEWHVVPCKLSKLALKGIQLQRQNQTALLPYKKIHTISVGRLRIIDPANASAHKVFLVVDLVTQNSENSAPVIYRLQSDEIAFQKMFPGVDQTFEEAVGNLVGIVINNSNARCLPNRESCIGPNFANYPEMSRYEIRLREKL